MSAHCCIECLTGDALLCRKCAEKDLSGSVDRVLERFSGLYLRWQALTTEERREELGYCIKQLALTIMPPSVPKELDP